MENVVSLGLGFMRMMKMRIKSNCILKHRLPFQMIMEMEMTENQKKYGETSNNTPR